MIRRFLAAMIGAESIYPEAGAAAVNGAISENHQDCQHEQCSGRLSLLADRFVQELVCDICGVLVRTVGSEAYAVEPKLAAA